MARLGTDGATSQLHSLKRWVIGRLGRIEHERRVARTAFALAGVTSSLHALTIRHRRLLKLAALVHDVGRCKAGKAHAIVGAEMILDNATLPLSGSDRRALAYLTRYHKGAVPELGHDEILKDGDDLEGLRTVLGFLRAADALDSRSLESPQLSISLRGRRVRITCRLAEESSKARRVFSRRKKFRLLERTLGCRVEVNVVMDEALAMVA